MAKRMPSTTAYGVCYDLSNSPYVSELVGLEFAFTTRENQHEFEYGWFEHMKWLEDSFSRRFRFNFDLYEFAIFDWYRRVETRGFCVRDASSQKTYIRPEDVVIRGCVDYAEETGS